MGHTRERVYLSSPQVTETEIEYVTAALRSGWVAPLGPEVDAFEADISTLTGTAHAVALSSGTAALQLGMMGVGVQPGDEVAVGGVVAQAGPVRVVEGKEARPHRQDRAAAGGDRNAGAVGMA